MHTKDTNQAIVCRGCGTILPSGRKLGKGFCSAACANRFRTRPIADRFWDKVAKSDYCWEWQGALRPNGYGMFGYSNGDIRLSHRVAWELTYGPIPDDMMVCHHCDNRRCVRPDHLFIGTNSDNVLDMVRKGRKKRGDQVANAVLTEEKVRSIRELCSSSMKSHEEIAERFGVSRSAISQIRRRVTWKHVA